MWRRGNKEFTGVGGGGATSVEAAGKTVYFARAALLLFLQHELLLVGAPSLREGGKKGGKEGQPHCNSSWSQFARDCAFRGVL
jgi:hypothetical protein